MITRANPESANFAGRSRATDRKGPAHAVPEKQGPERALAASSQARGLLRLRRQTSQNGSGPTAQFLSFCAPIWEPQKLGCPKERERADGSIPQILASGYDAKIRGWFGFAQPRNRQRRNVLCHQCFGRLSPAAQQHGCEKCCRVRFASPRKSGPKGAIRMPLHRCRSKTIMPAHRIVTLPKKTRGWKLQQGHPVSAHGKGSVQHRKV